MPNTQLKDILTNQFPQFPWEFEKVLAPLTYMKIGGPAEAFVALSSTNQISELVQFCTKQNLKLTILGGASNVVISDAGIRGVVLQIQNTSITKEATGNGYTSVLAGAGSKMAPLVAKTVEMGLTGLEYFLGVPGTLGGAIYNNAHYLQDLIGEHVSEVFVLNRDGSTYWIPVAECNFAYEQSRFQESKEIIIEVRLTLAAGTREESQKKIAHATQYRATTQPLGIPSSGCIFQNVPNTPHLQKLFPLFADAAYVPGGYIIDQAQLKGTTSGGITVSQKHAAWFENTGTGSSSDVKKLITKVKDIVKTQFGVELHEEVFYLD